MKKSIFTVLVFSVAVLMCSCGEQSAIYVNDTIVNETDKVDALMSKVYDFIDEDEYDNALAYLDSVANQAKESEAIIAGLKYKSVERLQQAALEYLTMYKQAATDFRQVIEWYQSEDDGLIDKGDDLVSDFDEKTDKKLSEIQTLQIEFAKKNNFELEYE